MLSLRRGLSLLARNTIQLNQKCGLLDPPKFELYIPPLYKDVIVPKNNLLPALDPTPFTTINNTTEKKMQRKIEHIRGPETIHNTFLHQQYGVIALNGCQLHHGHINQIRMTVNRWLNKRTFAIWRIPAPWKSITRRGAGKKSGKGKAGISFYVTPIKAGRVILEVGGKAEFEEVQHFLNRVCKKLPCHAIAISQEELDEYRKEFEEKKSKNLNPITRHRMAELNLCNSHDVMSKYDKFWQFQFEN